ncbi:hypothetical protein Amsp01_094290 [Amycolatopsis sp. NBRC 101858]|uniref:hypothetical protein n=1 Tax=Amycolatopsis sp. NBRC 101858 TaxID=3032200 RepID=UPI0024A0164E|nr:hypothetical protein [Amycolatopsis sp. NBRC 101858]GLY43406.1 hypothetical protein Amsp01_094290 [Amycolatopsis sp. NBRC 101858]
MHTRPRLVFLLVVFAVLAGCTSEKAPSSPMVSEGAAVSPFAVPDPAPKILEKNTAVGAEGASVQVGAAQVTVPAGLVTAGTEIHVPQVAQIDRQPAELYGQPVNVQHDAPLRKPVIVRWTLPAMSDVQRASLVLVHWSEQARAWEPRLDQPFRIEGGVLTAELAEFSFWDWVANVGQKVGEITGARKDGPKCGGAALTSWVRGVVDPDEGTPAAAIRVCFEPDHDDLVTIRVVNNRPFTQQLTMSSGNQNWAWTWPGPPGHGVAAAVYDAARAVFDSKTSYLLPPLTEVAVGIDRPAEPGQVVIGATAKVTRATVFTDVVRFAMDQVNVGGFENPLLTAFVQAVYECGGKQLLTQPDLGDPAAFVRTVLGTIGSCAEEIRRGDSEFGKRFEQLSLAAIKKLGATGDAVVIKANRLAYQAAGAIKALTFAEVAFYVTDQLQNALVGPLTLSVRGNGRPQQLGGWTPTCRNTTTDADALYRNVALQDQFQDTSKELWQFPGWDAAAEAGVRPLSKCGPGYLTQLAAAVPGRWADKKAAGVIAGKIRALATRNDPHAVRFDGIGALSLSLTARDLKTQGYVDTGNAYDQTSPSCVRYAKDGENLSFSVEAKTGRVLAIRNFGGDQALHTQIGAIRVGSTLAQLRKAFAGYSVDERLAGDFGQGSNGVIVSSPAGAIGLGLADASAGDYAAGRATVDYVAGVGLPGQAPSRREDGC